jgi:hypothetical protein
MTTQVPTTPMTSPKSREYPVLSMDKTMGVLRWLKVLVTEINPMVAPRPKGRRVHVHPYLKRPKAKTAAGKAPRISLVRGRAGI